MELTVAYSPEMNGIAERINGFVASKARCLLLDAPSKIGQSFWPEVFTTSIYLLNRSYLSFLKYDCPLAVWLRAYNFSNKSYTPDLGHLRTFGCQVYTKILDERWVKSQKTAPVWGRERYFMGYTSESIYRVYFPDSRRIETVRDLEFDESYDNEEMGTTAAEEPLFSFPKLEPLTDNTFNTPVRDEELPAPSVSHSAEDDSDPLSAHSSDDDSPPAPRRSTRIRHEPTRYGLVAQHIALSSVAQSEIREPLSYNEAMRSPEAHLWKQAMDEEISSLYENHTWDLVDPPANTPILRGKWVYKLKYNIDGLISRYKARWVAKGFQQREGIDLEETFSPVVKSCTTQVLNALAAHYGWNIEQMDAVTAYLNSDIDVILYIETPTGYKIVGKICLLRKTIYGLKQSARQWSKDLNRSMIKAGLKRLMSDYSAFAKNLGTSKVVIVIVYVDDFLFFGPDLTEINIIKSFLADQYKMKDLGSCGQFTGIKLERNLEAKTISLSQRVYIQKALDQAGMLDSKPVHSPLVSGIDFIKNVNEPADEDFIRLYQSYVGTHMWAYVCTRPDLGFAVSTLSRFSSDPTLEHMIAVKRLYQYLQATKDLKIVYRGGLTQHPRLEVYTDADWAGDKETRRSTSAYVAMLAGCPVSWSSKRQTTVAQSSTEAEYIAASEATKEAVWIGRLLEELCQPEIYPIPLHCDNQGSIALAKNPENHQRTKHIDVWYHYIREKEEDGTIAIDYLPTEDMLADGLTKPLTPAKMKIFVKQLGLC